MEPEIKRFRIQYTKDTPLRFIGHLDLLRAWERILRRARLPLAYTQGYHPHARINLGAALPLGFTSACELAEFWLQEEVEKEELVTKIEAQLPDGLTLHSLMEVPLRFPSLQKIIRSAIYEVRIQPQLAPAEAERRSVELLSRERIPMTRRNKAYDLRPLIEELQLRMDDGSPVFVMRLQSREGATGRPDEVVRALDEDPLLAQIHRSQLILVE